VDEKLVDLFYFGSRMLKVRSSLRALFARERGAWSPIDGNPNDRLSVCLMNGRPGTRYEPPVPFLFRVFLSTFGCPCELVGRSFFHARGPASVKNDWRFSKATSTLPHVRRTGSAYGSPIRGPFNNKVVTRALSLLLVALFLFLRTFAVCPHCSQVPPKQS
jgi:hypothetical protein